MSFNSVIPPSKTRSRAKPASSSGFARLTGLVTALLSQANPSTALLVGATLQTLLVLILPPVYALTPAFLCLATHSITTLLISTKVIDNPYLRSVLPKKITAQVLPRSGKFTGPGKDKVAILLLGAKSNHPLGILAPDFPVVGEYLQQMTSELNDPSSQDNGFLGATGFNRRDANGAIEYLQISYWRSIEDVHAYAHGPLHSKAWSWWNRTLKSHDHIGFMHEVFEAPAGMWEGVYVNFQPTLMGATTYLRKEEKGGELEAGNVDEKWVSGLFDANSGKLKTSKGRRGYTNAALDHDGFGDNVYV